MGQEESNPANDRPLRVEIPAKSTDETYRVIPCGPVGMILFFKSVETVGDTLSKWYFSFYDPNLHQSWAKSIPLGNGMTFVESSFSNDTLAMLFYRPGKEKSTHFNFSIIRLVLGNTSFIGNGGNLPEETEEIEFRTLHRTAYISYNLKNESARLLVINLESGNSVTLNWSKGTVSKVSGFKVDSASTRIRGSLAKLAASKSRMENWLVSMDVTGKIIAEIPIQTSSPNRFMRDLDFLQVDPENWLVFGSYGTTPVKAGNKNKKVVESTGFFSCKLSSGQTYDINFVNLLEMTNAKELIGEKDIMALKKKALKKSRSIYEYSLDYPLMLHKVFRHKDQFILLAESFSAQYHSESFTDFDFYGRPYVNTYQVFDGYRYNNGIVTAYDKDGKLLWDNSIEIRNLVSFEINPKVTVFFTPDDNAVLAYLSEGKIASKIVRGNSVIEKLDFSPLELLNPGDKMLTETKYGMLPWYDKYFICYGYEEIKSINSTENKKRLVFFFTKIAFN
jgi:hypothetical protein